MNITHPRSLLCGPLALLLAGFLLGLASCNHSAVTPPAEVTNPPEPAGPPFFKDLSASAGVNITYKNGEEAGHLAILESLGGGIGLIDFDGDGLLDVFVPAGGYYEKTAKDLDALPKDDKNRTSAILGHPWKLYKNLGNFQFKDVTKEVGLDGPYFYTHGCAVGDFDNDGWPDLLITGWGRLALYHNEPDGKGGRRFVDVSKKAGLPEGLWTSSAAWADLDGDGFADLYVCQYADWSFANHPSCSYDGHTPDVCPPKQFSGLPHKVFRNNGNGTFTDVSQEAGLRPGGKDASKGLGVIIVDLNGDGKPDIYVANDTVDNFLYMNRSTPGKIRLEEKALPAGVARDDKGQPDGSMGLATADYDRCGRPALWVTNYENESHCLYHNECDGRHEFFSFKTHVSGIGAIGQTYVGWGTGFLDLDHHGWEDLFIVNGHAIRFPTGKTKRAERPVLMRNLGGGRFKNVTDQGGPYFQTEHVARGVAFGDLDNDGRIDAVVSHFYEPVGVLRNEADVGSNHWLGVQLEGKKHRDMVGAKVMLGTQTRFAHGGGSYTSSSDRRQVFGLGREAFDGRVTVVWPSGETQHWEGLAVDKYWRLVQGDKEARPLAAKK